MSKTENKIGTNDDILRMKEEESVQVRRARSGAFDGTKEYQIKDLNQRYQESVKSDLPSISTKSRGKVVRFSGLEENTEVTK